MVAVYELERTVELYIAQVGLRKKFSKTGHDVACGIITVAIERATGCNPRAGEARGAGSESPTVLPENEDGRAERCPANATDRTTVLVAANAPPALWGHLALWGRGSFAGSLPSLGF